MVMREMQIKIKNHLEINYTPTNTAIIATGNTMCLQRYKETANVHCWCIWHSHFGSF